MDSDIILALKNVSVEIFVIAFIVFALTMVLKLPIKKFTSKFDDNKRKAINTIILLIPALLSIILSILYFGILKKDWFCIQAFESSISIFVLSLTIYAIFSRIITLIKGLKSGKISIDSKEAKETIATIQSNLSSLTNILQIDKSKLDETTRKITELLKLKSSIENSNTTQCLTSIEDITNEISSLQCQKIELENEINNTQSQINDCSTLLKK